MIESTDIFGTAQELWDAGQRLEDEANELFKMIVSNSKRDYEGINNKPAYEAFAMAHRLNSTGLNFKATAEKLRSDAYRQILKNPNSNWNKQIPQPKLG